MPHDIHHEHLIKELAEQLEPVFSGSPQGIYLYLDDEHKICNQKFANMLGYKSIQEWVKNDFPVEDVSEKDRDKVINAYAEASQKFVAASLNATCIRKDGKKINTQVIMVPITYKEETFVLHFISKI
jgi:PAS domain S-box-containing protein